MILLGENSVLQCAVRRIKQRKVCSLYGVDEYKYEECFGNMDEITCGENEGVKIGHTNGVLGGLRNGA